MGPVVYIWILTFTDKDRKAVQVILNFVFTHFDVMEISLYFFT